MQLHSMRLLASAFATALALLWVFSIAWGQVPALLLFGGRDHDVFLGCLNCSRLETVSVCNRFGEKGSRFSSKSIWNRLGDYGSRLSHLSPWNKLAPYPPVVVDRDGSFYGYFTANRVDPTRTQIKFFLTFLDNVDEVNNDLERARDLFCGD